jgi:hypothetical protein
MKEAAESGPVTCVRAIAAQLNERGSVVARGTQRLPRDCCRDCKRDNDRSSARELANGSPIAARFARNTPDTRFQKCRVKPRLPR